MSTDLDIAAPEIAGPPAGLDLTALEQRLDSDGVAVTPPLLTPAQCADVVTMFDEDARFRSTVVMARHSFGEGSYRYFADPLPPLVQALRERLYPPIAAIANRPLSVRLRAQRAFARSACVCAAPGPRKGTFSAQTRIQRANAHSARETTAVCGSPA